MEEVWTFFSAILDFLSSHKELLQSVFSGVGVATIVASWALSRWIIARRRSEAYQPQLRSEIAQRNRQRMLEKVRHMWIEGVLEQSLYRVARIELGLSEKPDAIEHPWKFVAQQAGGRELKELPAGTPMHAVFDEFDKTLLLLGAPGSGKTTLLLELTRDLIERAKADPTHPIPVVFNLSSWALKRPSIEVWLVDELNQRYDVPRKVAQAWVADYQVLPLLDGLDEVASEHRDACVEAINAFRAEHGLLPLLVCCRSAEYEALTARLRLSGAVTIEPLTREQVEQYFARARDALSAVDAAVRQDTTLWELLDTPLMLSILASAYQGGMASEVRISRLKGDLEERRASLSDAYIEAMFTRRAIASRYTPQQTRRWLSWLSRVMEQHDQTIFYLERIQPSWLPEKEVRKQRIGVVLISGLGAGLIFGFVFGLGAGLFVGLPFALVGGLNVTGTIKPVEVLHWSWEEARSGLFFGLGVGLLFGLLGGLVGGLGAGLTAGLFVGLFLGFFIGLVSGLGGALVAEEISVRVYPNEGIRRSVRNALTTGVGVAVGAGLIFGLLFGLFFGVTVGLGAGLFVGLFFALLFGLMKGGYVGIQHGLLRMLLWRAGYAPLNYVRFLDHMTEQQLLRKVGGGYIFVGRIIMENFAGSEVTEEVDRS